MAKVTAPLFSLDASGGFGETIVYAKWKGIRYARQYVIPANPRTAQQLTQRSYFLQGVNAWHGEDAATREQWNSAAQGRAISGFNLYMQRYLRYLRENNGTAPPSPFLPQ
ncbi:MAG: hypothetical protein D9V47_12440 [Clostridia bacterium]|nr:MAG: hypothetical protein D9V47_12440 [Clostridia bacterium]